MKTRTSFFLLANNASKFIHMFLHIASAQTLGNGQCHSNNRLFNSRESREKTTFNDHKLFTVRKAWGTANFWRSTVGGLGSSANITGIAASYRRIFPWIRNYRIERQRGSGQWSSQPLDNISWIWYLSSYAALALKSRRAPRVTSDGAWLVRVEMPAGAASTAPEKSHCPRACCAVTRANRICVLSFSSFGQFLF